MLKQVANLFEHIVNMLEQINDFLCAVKRHFSHVFSRLRTFTNSIIRSVSTESGETENSRIIGTKRTRFAFTDYLPDES